MSRKLEALKNITGGTGNTYTQVLESSKTLINDEGSSSGGSSDTGMTILLDYCSDDGDYLYIGNPENNPPAGLNQEDFFNAIIHVENNYEGNITHHWANVIGTYQYTDENNNEIVEFYFLVSTSLNHADWLRRMVYNATTGEVHEES